MTINHPIRGRRVLRTLGVSLASAAFATAAVAGLGFRPSTAQADPGDTFVAIGSSQLMTSEDLQAAGIKLNTETVSLNLDKDFSTCLGEGNSWTAVVRSTGKPISAWWTNRKGKGALSEYIAQAKTMPKADRAERRLIDSAIELCQADAPRRFDFYYGPTDSSGVSDGHATWAVRYTSKGVADGGIAVIRRGTNVGLVQVSGSWGQADQMMESVAKQATHRLVMSS